MRRILVDSEDYRRTTELSMQYSHDTYTADVNPTEHYLEIHREYYLNSSKNQDVIMVGQTLRKKKEALTNMVEKLKCDGFQRIVFYNTSIKTGEILFDSGQVGKQYRGIYVGGMSHKSMIACTALSGPLMGATGDQSLGEALSANKIMVYEVLSHKRDFLSSYYQEMGVAGCDVSKTGLPKLTSIMTNSLLDARLYFQDKRQTYYQSWLL